MGGAIVLHREEVEAEENFTGLSVRETTGTKVEGHKAKENHIGGTKVGGGVSKTCGYGSL